MSLNFSLGIRVSPGTYKRVKVNDVNPNARVGDLKVEAAKITNLPMESLELAYCGNILEDDQMLEECGLKPGVTVHVMRKNISNDLKQNEAISDDQIKAVSNAFRSISLNRAVRSALQSLKQASNLENLLMITPALLNDPVAIAIIQDPELFVRMADLPTARRIVENHPALAETANYIAGAVQNEAVRQSTPTINYNDNSFAYSLDEFSDEEEMDSSQSSDSVAGSSSRGNRDQITGTQLAAALASATGLTGAQTPQASTSSGQSSSPAFITSEMLNEAMQNAIAMVPPSNGSSFLSSTPPPTSTNPQIPPTATEAISRTAAEAISRNIQQMHDMGLIDDVANMHALAITNGDVQAAINLVLSGAVTHDDDF